MPRAFLENVGKIYGLSKEIISYRDTKFTGEFWTALCKLLKIKLSKSTAYYPPRYGLTKRINKFLEAYLRNFAKYDPDSRCDLRPLAKYAYNKAETPATKITPSFANNGFHPRTTSAVEVDAKNTACKLYAH